MRADAQANREKILDAAKSLFAERGVEDVDVREICDRAGVGMGTLYRHFPTKDELVDEVVRELAQGLALIMDRFDRRENERPPLVEWLAFHEQWGHIGREVHERFAILRRCEGGAVPGRSNQYFRELRERRLGQWREIRDSGAVRQDIPAEFMMEASDGLLDIYLDLRRRWDPEQTREWLASIFAEGFRTRNERPPQWYDIPRP